jgi:hypothetical protein
MPFLSMAKNLRFAYLLAHGAVERRDIRYGHQIRLCTENGLDSQASRQAFWRRKGLPGQGQLGIMPGLHNMRLSGTAA